MSALRDLESPNKNTQRGASNVAHAYPTQTHPDVQDAQAKDVFWLLICFRVANALSLSTFFQPDEYFQSLEPAWAMVFGPESGTWKTWEWHYQLRSSLHPVLFAIAYHLASILSYAVDLSPPLNAELLVATPKVIQGVIAAFMDYYTWKLSERIHGHGSPAAWAALTLTVISPWQWFASTRTLSNNLETTLTIIALYLWPWQWTSAKLDQDAVDQDGLRMHQETGARGRSWSELTKIRCAVLLAGLACIIRPTNGIIWSIAGATTLFKASSKEKSILLREAILCGSTILALEGLVDRWFYQKWTFPPVRLMYFNIARHLSVFYGTNRLDYYFTEGLPLLLTTALPFALAGVWRSIWTRRGLPPNLPGSQASKIQIADSSTRTLTLAACALLVSLSLLAHKEVRFIYPTLPILHVLASEDFGSFFDSFPAPRYGWRKLILFLMLGINIGIAIYASFIHQRGVVDVVTFLRRQHGSALYDLAVGGKLQNSTESAKITAGFLMPCHSTPWRSHLVHPTIDAWALTCDPPLDIPLAERHSYMDEADQFYANPKDWLMKHMRPYDTASRKHDGKELMTSRNTRVWPDYLIFFGHLEAYLLGEEVAKYYSQVWRGFNSHWHDDYRRQGDVVVWRLNQDDEP
ncbi:MAG: glycosylphosphatidylinositol anchor biosynthesis [Bogoriella megaspora]|nr:MAG: glycosylphosphatidylinositol anchor biosynthesis [Bogoriella megaspora]